MLFGWFDATEAKKFGESLGSFFLQNMPVGSLFGEKAFAQKTDKLMKQMVVQIEQFTAKHKLNTYKKAQLGNAFNWKLKDAKVSEDYADKMTRWLMLHIR